MKNLLTVKNILVLSMFATTVSAQSKSQIINIQGKVEEKVMLEFEQTEEAKQINGSTDHVNVPLLKLNAFSNSFYGFMVKARSENSGKLINEQGIEVPYSLKFGESLPIVLKKSDVIIKDLKDLSENSTKNILINFKGTITQSGSFFKDEITLTVESN